MSVKNTLRFTLIADVYVDNVKSIQYIKDVLKERFNLYNDPIKSKYDDGEDHSFRIGKVRVKRNELESKKKFVKVSDIENFPSFRSIDCETNDKWDVGVNRI